MDRNRSTEEQDGKNLVSQQIKEAYESGVVDAFVSDEKHILSTSRQEGKRR